MADLVGAALDPVLARQGFSESDLILNWEDIVGERLGATSRPIKVHWPPRPPGRSPDAPLPTATLLIRVEGGFAIELQHMADAVIARVNSHLGWRCIGKLSFRQGPIERAAVPNRRRPPPSPAKLAAAEEGLVDVGDDALRSALGRLGAHVLK